jgi:hypothetical protein
VVLPGAGLAPVTTTAAMNQLHRSRDQVHRLLDTRVLPPLGRAGRVQLIDPAALAALAGRRQLADTGPGHPDAEPYALALHLGPREPDSDPHNQRQWVGWNATTTNPDDAWVGWWNTGPGLADQFTERQLPLLAAVSGFVVDVRVIGGWTPHPVYRGLVRFTPLPAPPQVLAAFRDTVFRPAPGAPWQRLWRPRTSRPEGLP